MTFRCIVPNGTIGVEWLINETSASSQEGLVERGIKYNDTLMISKDTRFSVIGIEARAENNGTKLECIAFNSDLGTKSQIVFLYVQGTCLNVYI